MQIQQFNEQSLIERIEKQTVFKDMIEELKNTQQLPTNTKEQEDKMLIEVESEYERCRNQLEVIYKNKVAYFKDLEK